MNSAAMGWTDKNFAYLTSNQDILDHRYHMKYEGSLFRSGDGVTMPPKAKWSTGDRVDYDYRTCPSLDPGRRPTRKDLSHIEPARMLVVSVPAYPGRVFQGKIVHVAGCLLDSRSRTAKCAAWCKIPPAC